MYTSSGGYPGEASGRRLPGSVSTRMSLTHSKNTSALSGHLHSWGRDTDRHWPMSLSLMSNGSLLQLTTAHMNNLWPWKSIPVRGCWLQWETPTARPWWQWPCSRIKLNGWATLSAGNGLVATDDPVATDIDNWGPQDDWKISRWLPTTGKLKTGQKAPRWPLTTGTPSKCRCSLWALLDKSSRWHLQRGGHPCQAKRAQSKMPGWTRPTKCPSQPGTLRVHYATIPTGQRQREEKRN